MLYTFPPSDRSRRPFFYFLLLFSFFSLAKSCRSQQGVANLPPLSHFTAHFPQQPSCGIRVSFHTWCCSATWSQHSRKNNHARLHKQMPSCEYFPFFCFFFVCLFAKLVALSVPTLASFSVSMESLHWIDRRVYYIQANEHCNSWLTAHSCPGHSVLRREGWGLYNSNYI